MAVQSPDGFKPPLQERDLSGVAVVAVQRQLADQPERRPRAMDLGNYDGAVVRDNRSRGVHQKLLVERRIWPQSVWTAVGASLCTALIAAWIW